MIANYGYKDAEGEFYITIETGRCEGCTVRPCIAACPKAMFVEDEAPYGGEVVAIDDLKRKMLKYECAECKPTGQRPPLPCVAACPYDAITHSW